MTYPQGTVLEATKDFTFKPSYKGARTVTVSVGQRFWVTNTQVSQNDGAVLLHREGNGTISTGYPFAASDIETLFKLVS